jgi:hypothetical protein
LIQLTDVRCKRTGSSSTALISVLPQGPTCAPIRYGWVFQLSLRGHRAKRRFEHSKKKNHFLPEGTTSKIRLSQQPNHFVVWPPRTKKIVNPLGTDELLASTIWIATSDPKRQNKALGARQRTILAMQNPIIPANWSGPGFGLCEFYHTCFVINT